MQKSTSGMDGGLIAVLVIGSLLVLIGLAIQIFLVSVASAAGVTVHHDPVIAPKTACCQHIDDPANMFKDCSSRGCEAYGSYASQCPKLTEAQCKTNKSSCTWHDTTKACAARTDAPASYLRTVDMGMCDRAGLRC